MQCITIALWRIQVTTEMFFDENRDGLDVDIRRNEMLKKNIFCTKETEIVLSMEFCLKH